MSNLAINSSGIAYSSPALTFDVNSVNALKGDLCFSWNNQEWLGLAPQWNAQGLYNNSVRPWAVDTVCGLNNCIPCP